MRWDSPPVLVSAATFTVHLIAIVVIDAIRVTHPYVPPPPAPRIEMIDVSLPARPRVAPPPAPPPVAPAAAIPPPAAPPPPRSRPRSAAVRTQPPPSSVEPTPALAAPTPPTPAPAGSGGPTLKMSNLGPAARGVEVGTGPGASGHGRGGGGRGSGRGTGAGADAGAGSGAGAPAAALPASIATIKTRALPKEGYGYFDAGKDYPTEARQLGIEGPIRVRLVVSAEGAVKSAILLNKLGHGLDELALARARAILFTAARDTSDRPVDSVVVWTFHMTLPK